MHTKTFKALCSFIGTMTVIAALLTGCGGDSAPKVVAKDIDAIALMEKLMSDDSKERFDALIELGEGRENAAPAMDMILEVLTDEAKIAVSSLASLYKSIIFSFFNKLLSIII